MLNIEFCGRCAPREAMSVIELTVLSFPWQDVSQ